MDELVFCCPQCLHVSRSGIITDSGTMMRSLRRPIFVGCAVCHQFNCVMIEDALLTASLDAHGHFIAVDQLQTAATSDARGTCQ